MFLDVLADLAILACACIFVSKNRDEVKRIKDDVEKFRDDIQAKENSNNIFDEVKN